MQPTRDSSAASDEIEPTFNGEEVSEEGARVAMAGLKALKEELAKKPIEQNSARLDALANATLAGIGCTDFD